jgi:RHS repeat-associated protein
MRSGIDPSGVSETAVVLPKGGGAFEGIGETFAPDAQSGTFQVSVPIEVPPGRRAAVPLLTLSYSSGAGNGPFGLGWTVSVPRVTRSTRKGIPCYDETDSFLLDGEDLVCVGPWTDVSPTRAERRYRMSGERAFHRVVRVRGDTGEWWEVTGSDGTATFIGQDLHSRVQMTSADAAAQATARVFGWLTTFTSDPLGNRVRYGYKTDGASCQVYLSRVDYVEEPGDRWLYSVLFDYGEYADNGAEVRAWGERPDAFSEFRSSFEIRTARRCRRILVMVNEQDKSEVSTRYDLEYDSAGGNGVSLLRSVTRVGIGPNESQNHPPVEFGYGVWQPGNGAVERIEGRVPRGGVGPGIEVLDGDGFALAGVVVTHKEGNRYWSNDGQGRLRMRDQSGPPGTSLAHADVWLADLTGDGYPDLGYFGDEPGFFAALPGEGWAKQMTRLQGQSPIDTKTDNGRFVDVDGDGRIDVLKVVSGEFRVYHNGGPESGWGTPQKAPIPADVGGVDFSDRLTALADVSGDGPIDLVRFKRLVTPPGGACSVEVRYWPHLGHGLFADRARVLRLPLVPADGADADDPFASGLDPERLRLVDVDGDGYDDVVYLGRVDAIVWLNQSGNRFATPVRIRLSLAGPTDDEMPSVRAVDWFARGTADLLWSTRVADSPLRLVRLTRDEKPYLLTRVSDHRGATATISYRSSARFARADEDAGQAWRTHLPFPVHVVDQVTLTDEFSHTTTTTRFTYHEGAWDGVEREFRGFARVEQDDAEVADPERVADHQVSPPVHTVTWFHVGVAGGADAADELDLSEGYWTTPTDAGTPREAGPLVSASARWVNWLEGKPAGVRRKALRALRGKPARVEQYLAGDRAWDDGRPRPYSVIEYGYELRPERDGRDELSWQDAPVVAVLNRGQRTSQWERGSDPMTRAKYELHHDEYGRARLLADVAVPRGRDPYVPGPANDPYLVEVIELTFATQGPDERGHMLDRVAAEVRYELAGETAGALRDLVNRIETEERTSWKVIGATATFYDAPAYEGRPLGRLGPYGLPTRVEKLALTPDVVSDIFDGQQVPPWLKESDGGPWPADYPPEFQAAILRAGPNGGYVRGGDGVPEGLYVTEVARRFDVHPDPSDHAESPERDGIGYGLVVGSRDGCGVTTMIKLDRHRLRPARVVTGGRLEQVAEYEYRTQQPVRVVDENDHETRYTYTPLGLLNTVVRTGPPGLVVGESEDEPGVVYTYGLTEYDDAHRPVWIRTVTRLLPDLLAEQCDYSDGFDRLLQSRARVSSPIVEDIGLTPDHRAEPTEVMLRQPGDPSDPLVRVTGWVGYDNKGRVIEEYEPFFDHSWEYRPTPTTSSLPRDVLCAITRRDARGVPVQITHPDGTQRRFVHGRPKALTDPDNLTPSAWESFEYDADDNARRTHPDADPSWHAHADTPASVEVDARGRVIVVTERAGSVAPTTRARWDLNDNVLEVTDALGRIAYRGVYDLLGRPWRETTLDGGKTVMVRDPLGDPVERRDARGAVTLDGYDALHRLSRRWANRHSGVQQVLQEAVVYGDDARAPGDAKRRNLRGRPWSSYDLVGVTTTEAYDVYNNPAVRTRRWLPATRIARLAAQVTPKSIWPPSEPGDQEADAPLLDEGYVTVGEQRDRTGAVHAVSVTGLGLPERVVTYERDSVGEVTAISVGTGTGYEPVLRRRVVDPGKQQVLLDRGVPLTTRFLRDPRTTMLLRQRTDGSRAHVHDSCLEHGPTGVVLRLRERTPIGGRDRTIDFAYDALHRLKRATGAVIPTSTAEPWDPPTGTPTSTGSVSYEYDDVGNLLNHRLEVDGHVELWEFTPGKGSNRIATLDVQHDEKPPRRIEYTTDAAGNVTTEGATRTFTWDHAQRLSRVSVMSSSGEQTSAHWYVGDLRLCTANINAGSPTRITHLTDWVTVVLTERNQGHPDYEVSITVTCDGTPEGEPLAWHRASTRRNTAVTLYLLPDYLGSIRAIVGPDGTLVQITDYTPYGQIRHRRSSGATATLPRPLGYANGEEELTAGLVLLGRRPYAPWLCRFLSVETLEDLRAQATKALSQISDPADPPPHRIPAWAVTPYTYAANSPATVIDRGGREPKASPGCRERARDWGGVIGTGIGAGIGHRLGGGPGAAAGASVGHDVGESVGGLVGGYTCPPESSPESGPTPQPEKGSPSPRPDKGDPTTGGGASQPGDKGASGADKPTGKPADKPPERKEPVGSNGPYTRVGGYGTVNSYNDVYRDKDGNLVRVPRGSETPIPAPNNQRPSK